MIDTRDNLVTNSLNKLKIRQLLDTPDVTDVAINEPLGAWLEIKGIWTYVSVPELTYDNLIKLANLLAVYSGLKGNFSINYCQSAVTLPTGERGHILSSPVTKTGTIAMSFRKPSTNRFSLDDYLSTNRLSGFKLTTTKKLELQEFQKNIFLALKKDDLKTALHLAVENKLNIALIGGTGSGKTTLTKSIADLYPINRRYMTLETSHELNMPNHPNTLHLFYDDEYQDKKKTSENPALVVSPHECIKSCLRLKPDHIFLTELRGSEAWYYFEALNTGHRGSLTTFHANDTVSSYERCLDMLREHATAVGMNDKQLIIKCKKTIDIVISMEYTKVIEVYYNPEEQLSLYKENIY